MLYDQCVRCGGSGHNSSTCKRYFSGLSDNGDKGDYLAPRTASPRPDLAQMLASFDPRVHSGEVMSDSLVGAEVFADPNPLKSPKPR